MPARRMKKENKFTDAAIQKAAAVDEASRAASYPKDKPTRKAPKPAKETRGRKPTVDYPRDDQLTFPITKELNAMLGKAAAVESGKRYPQRVDKGFIIEEALTAWFAKKGY